VSCNNQAQQDPIRQDVPGPGLDNAPYNAEMENLTEEQRKMIELEGGPEITGRQQNPVSNDILQQKYPNIVALSGSKDDYRVALTFDDGPDPRYTPQILDILKQYNAKATFFLIGVRAVAYEDITRRIVDEGHTIANHSYWHPNFDKEGAERLDWEIKKTEEALNNIVGFRTRLLRAPYGSLNEELVEKIDNLGYTAIGWSVDSSDWMQLSPEQIQKNVLSNASPGSIILMHDGGNWNVDLLGTAQSLHEIIPRLQKDGIEFVTIPELLNIRDRK